MGFFVGFGFGLAGVVLSHGDGLGFVMKFGSVVTCHGVDDQDPKEIMLYIKITDFSELFLYLNLPAETLAKALSSLDESLKLSNGNLVVGLLVVGFV